MKIKAAIDAKNFINLPCGKFLVKTQVTIYDSGVATQAQLEKYRGKEGNPPKAVGDCFWVNYKVEMSATLVRLELPSWAKNGAVIEVGNGSTKAIVKNLDINGECQLEPFYEEDFFGLPHQTDPSCFSNLYQIEELIQV